jgi:hypothetical protein
MREHVGVAAAGGNVGQADRGQFGADARPRQRGADHDALTELEVVIVERHDQRIRAERACCPFVIDPIEPWQIDDAGADAVARQFIGGTAGTAEQQRSVPDDGDITAGA